MSREFPESQKEKVQPKADAKEKASETSPEKGVEAVAEKPSDGGEAALPVEGYRWVRFHIKSKPDDADDVILSVQGNVLVMQRDKKVPVPNRYIDLVQNAKCPQFRQMPNEDRKVIGEIRTYPYDDLGEATEKDYLEWKTDGTKASRDSLERRAGSG